MKTFDKKFEGISFAQLYQDNVPHSTTLQGTEMVFYSGFKELSRLYHDNHSS